jgi:hypothetical protein
MREVLIGTLRKLITKHSKFGIIWTWVEFAWSIEDSCNFLADNTCKILTMFKPFESWDHIDNMSSLQDWMNQIGSQRWQIYKKVWKTFHQFLDPNFTIGSKNQPFLSFKMSCTLCSHSLFKKLSTIFTKEIRSRSHFKQWNRVSWLENLNARWIWGKGSSLKSIATPPVITHKLVASSIQNLILQSYMDTKAFPFGKSQWRDSSHTDFEWMEYLAHDSPVSSDFFPNLAMRSASARPADRYPRPTFHVKALMTKIQLPL